MLIIILSLGELPASRTASVTLGSASGDVTNQQPILWMRLLVKIDLLERPTIGDGVQSRLPTSGSDQTLFLLRESHLC